MLHSRDVAFIREVILPSQPSHHKRRQKWESSELSQVSKQQTLKAWQQDENVHSVAERQCHREKFHKLSAECCFLIFSLRRKPLHRPWELSRDKWSSELGLDAVARARRVFPGQAREPGKGEGGDQMDVLLSSFLIWGWHGALLLRKIQAPEVTGQTFRRGIQHMVFPLQVWIHVYGWSLPVEALCLAVDCHLRVKVSSAQPQLHCLGHKPKAKKKKHGLCRQLKKSQACPSWGSLMGAKHGKETWSRAGRVEAREEGTRKKYWEPCVYRIALLPLPSCPAPLRAACWWDRYLWGKHTFT